MGLDRAALIQGPAKIGWDSATFFSEGNITVEYEVTRNDRPVSGFGVVARPMADKMFRVRATLTQWDNLAKLFPYASTPIGTNVFGTADKPLVITPIDGAPLTLANAAITQMPNLSLGVSGSPLGEVVWTGLIANEAEADALASYLSSGTVASGVGLSGLDTTKILNDAYSAVYNSVTYLSEIPFAVNWALDLQPRTVEGLGTVAMIFAGLSATATFRPVGMTEAAYLALMGLGTGLGREPTRYPLTIAGKNAGSPTVTLNACAVEPGSTIYGASDNRHGDLNFTTVRTQTAGALDALFTVGAVGA
jgi:hypothetical protein